MSKLTEWYFRIKIAKDNLVSDIKKIAEESESPTEVFDKINNKLDEVAGSLDDALDKKLSKKGAQEDNAERIDT